MRGIFRDNLWINKLTADSLIYFLGKIIPSLLGFFTIIMLSRIFGKETYGQFSIILTIILASQIIFSGWILQGILRFFSESHSVSQKEFVNSVWRISYFTSFIGAVVLMGILFLLNKDDLLIIIFSIILFVLIMAFSIQSTFFQAKLQSRKYIYWDSIRALCIPLFTVLLYLLFRNKSCKIILSGYSLAYICVVFFMISLKDNNELRLKEPFRKDVFKNLFKYGMPLTLWLGSSYLLNVSDRYVIAIYHSYGDVGVYSAAYDIITRGLGVLFIPIINAAHPIIMDRWNKGDYESSIKVIKAGLIYEVGIFVPVAIIILIFRKSLVLFRLGPEFADASDIIFPIALGSFFWRLSMLIHKPLELDKKVLTMAVLVFIALASNLGLNFYFIPRFGYNAAAYTTLGSFFIYFIGVIIYILSRKRKSPG